VQPSKLTVVSGLAILVSNAGVLRRSTSLRTSNASGSLFRGRGGAVSVLMVLPMSVPKTALCSPRTPDRI
jgi:hypothetical protein